MELYGTDDVPRVPEEICNVRIRRLEERLAWVMSQNNWHENNDLINKILKAKRFWSKLRDGEENE